MRLPAVLAAVLLLAASAAASAQPALTPLSDPEVPPVPAHPHLIQAPAAPEVAPTPGPAVDGEWSAPPPGSKREAVATGLSLGATAAGYALAMGASGHDNPAAAEGALALVIVGPSAGHIYAGEWKHALGMSAVRTGGLLVFTLGLVSLVSDNVEANCWGGGCTSAPSDPHETGAGVAMLVGGTAFVVGTVYDIVDAHRAVQRHNAQLLQSAAFTPTIIHVPNGMAPGMAFTGTF